MAKADKVKQVVATGAAGRTSGVSGAEIQDAMTKAAEASYAKGVNDPDKVRAAMLKAREDLKRDRAREEREAAKAARDAEKE